jgi:hypothetical protein
MWFRRAILAVCILLMASGCGGEPAAEPEIVEEAPESAEPAEPAPEPTEAPTETPIPPTATPEPTPFPEGIIFRDDFEGELGEGWTWVNEDPSRYRLTDEGYLQIVGDDPGLFQAETVQQVNLLQRYLPDGPFVLEAHILANPSENFQQAAIFIWEKPGNYIAFNTGFCDLCLPNGYGFFFETFIDHSPFADVFWTERPPEATDVYLRLENTGESIFSSYALEPGNWVELGAFGNFFDFNHVGLSATNSNSETTKDIVANFDYFEIREP